MYDALFFDLDGTLIDSESLAVASGLAAFAETGFPVDLAFMHRLVGISGAGSVSIIRDRHPDIALDQLDALWRRGFQEAVQTSLTLKPGVTELLSHARHLPRVLVTSSRRTEAHAKLTQVGLGTTFTHVVTFDDVTDAKPAPRALPPRRQPPRPPPRPLPGVRRQRSRLRSRPPRRLRGRPGARRGAKPGPLGPPPRRRPDERGAAGRVDRVGGNPNHSPGEAPCSPGTRDSSMSALGLQTGHRTGW